MMCDNGFAGNDTGNVSDFPLICQPKTMRSKRHAITIQDVAKTAGVSVSTVSRVLNGKVDVAEETQLHIKEVIEQLGYTSSLAARSMRSQKSNLIGLIMPDIAYPFAFEVMKGVNRAIADSDYDLLVYTTGDVRKYGTASHEQHYVSLLNNSITDGVVIVAPVTVDFSTDAPIVAIDPLIINPSYHAIHATNFQGAVDAMEYLIGLGHTRIGYIGGRPELVSSNRRLEGYRSALLRAGLPIDESLILSGDYTTETGILCARQLLSLAQRPTAIFASNDQSAVGVYQVAKEMGLSIPADLSVVGFDNIPEAAYLDLTTVDQFIADMGFKAVKSLCQLIEGGSLEPHIQQMPTRLVVRGSCKQPGSPV